MKRSFLLPIGMVYTKGKTLHDERVHDMKRVILIVLDGVGVGSLPDASEYGDAGSCTLGHVVAMCRTNLPNLRKMGLGSVKGSGLNPDPDAVGMAGRAIEVSKGKDTTTGHWEITGLPLKVPFPVYPDGFPADVIKQYEKAIGSSVLGNIASSGTEIINLLGIKHMQTKKPIVYTSADSVFQVACHEDIYPPEELYRLCLIARELLKGEHGVGRVIARPFTGEAGYFVRTANRRDFSLSPPEATLLDDLKAAGMDSLAVGKIEDIFNHRGITFSDHAAGNEACVDALIRILNNSFTNGLMFVNLVDFDMHYGHRNDPEGFSQALESFDCRLPEIMSCMGQDDILIITADHGCDPTFPGTDHTREYVPVLAWHRAMRTLTDIGTRGSFADIAATVAEYLGISNRYGARSFCPTFASERR